MNDSKKITLAYLKKTYIHGLCIPEIQRDYVMGAGGKDDEGKDKLDKLLDAILAKVKANEDFDFSCIITYCSNQGSTPLEIYDGQQRLTTLMLMILYKLRNEKEDNVVNEFKEWYRFTGRPNANTILNLLINDSVSIDETINKIEVTDFTSFSMKNLLEKIRDSKYRSITSEYLLDHIKFDMVSIGSQNEIEQFFMDLNSGVKLKDYELYKAKLIHRINQLKAKYTNIAKSEVLEVLELWPHKMDNNWLDFFDLFADYEHPAEEYEVKFVKYCINMVFVENEENFANHQVEKIDVDVIYKVYNIMQLITDLNLSFYKNQKIESLQKGILHFSWGKTDSDDSNKNCNYDKRGALWKLDFEDYDRMLYYIIKFVLLDARKNIEMENDILLWCFIKTLDWQLDIQNEYLRLIKIILNHNVIENKNAWYECQNKGQYLYYCRYYVYAIPQYYGEHLKPKNDDNNEVKNRHSNMFILNKSFIQNVKISNMLSRGKIAINLMEQIRTISEENKIIENRIQQKREYDCYDDYVKEENEVFGIIEKIKKSTEEKEGYYLENVAFSWPTRGKNQSTLDCLVRLKCKTDFLFAKYNKDRDNAVKQTVNNLKKNFGEEFEKEFLDKCFWEKNLRKVSKLQDRVTQTSTTYNKKDSDSVWCRTWNIE